MKILVNGIEKEPSKEELLSPKVLISYVFDIKKEPSIIPGYLIANNTIPFYSGWNDGALWKTKDGWLCQNYLGLIFPPYAVAFYSYPY